MGVIFTVMMFLRCSFYVDIVKFIRLSTKITEFTSRK